MKNPRITSNQSEGSILVRCQNWKQFTKVMTGVDVKGAPWRHGRDILSVRIMRVNEYNISVATVKGWCR